MNENINKIEEIWKDIPEYEGYYQASNLGHVRSIDRRVPNRKKGYTDMFFKGRILKPKVDRYGYLMIVLSKEHIRKNTTVHRMIAKTFIPNPNNYPDINHKDNFKINNKIENLEWCTCQMNNFHRWKSKNQIEYKLNDGVIIIDQKTINRSLGHATKLNSQKVKEMRELYLTGKYTHEQLGQMFDVCSKYAYLVINRITWKHVL